MPDTDPNAPTDLDTAFQQRGAAWRQHQAAPPVPANDTATTASTRLSAVNGIPPQAGADASNLGPQVGVHPDVALQMPGPVRQQAEQAQAQRTVAGSPPLQTFLSGANAAQVADTQDSLPNLASIANGIHDFAAAPWEQAWKDIQSEYAKYQQDPIAYNHDPLNALRLAGIGTSASLHSVGVGYLIDQLNTIRIDPATQQFLQKAPIGAAAFGPLGPGLGSAGLGDILSTFGGNVGLSEAGAGLFGLATAGAGARGLPVPTGEPIVPGGGPAGGNPINPMLGPNGPLEFATVRDAAGYAARNHPGEGLRPEPYATDRGTFGVDQVPTLGGVPRGVSPEVDAVRAAAAQSDADVVARMQAEIADAPITGRSPATTAEFIAQQAPGDVVNIDPERLIELAAQGHVPFPNLTADTLTAAHDGTDVQIPLGTYLSATAGQPYAEALNAATTFREGGTSVDAAKEQPSGPVSTVVPGPSEAARAQLPADLTPEETAHIAATEGLIHQQLAQQVRAQFLAPLANDPKALGMSADQFARYSSGVERVVQDAADKMHAKLVRAILRERTPEWRAEVGTRAAAIREQIEALPVVRAHRALAQPGMRLDRDLVNNFYPGNASRLRGEVLKNGGNHPDDAADLLGYPSGAQLVSDLADLHGAIAGSGAKNLNEFVDMQATEAAKAAVRRELALHPTARDYDVSPEAIHQAASDLINSPLLTDFLSEELRALADKGGLPLDLDRIRALAAQRFGEKTVADALNIRKLEGYVYKGGTKAEAALQKGDVPLAFLRKQQQFLHHLQLQLAHKFAREFAKADKQMRSIGAKPIVRGMDQTFRNQLRAVVQTLGYPIKEGKYESVQSALHGTSLEAFHTALRERGLTPPNVPVPNGPVRALTVQTFRGVAAMVKGLAQLGKWERQVFDAGKAAELADVGAQVRANADAIGRPYTAGEQRLARMRLGGMLPGHLARTAGSYISRPETPLFWLDRESNGPLMRYVVNPLQQGKYYKAERTLAMSKAFNELAKTQPKGWERGLNAKVAVPELTYGLDRNGAPVPWLQTKLDVVMMATHFGTASNLKKLLDGFGWDEATARAVANRELTSADWKYVQFILDQHAELLPKVQELYRATAGLGMKEEPALPIPTPGDTLPGGYRHVSYDWNAVGEFKNAEGGGETVVRDPNALGESDLFGRDYRSATPPDAFTLERNASFSAPMNLDHSVLHRELEQVIHDLAFRQPLIQAAKVLGRQEVKVAIREALGPEYGEQFNQWLKDIARGASFDQAQLKLLASAVRGFRRRFTMAQIGYNVATLGKHGLIAAAHINGEVGVPEFAKAFADLHGAPATSGELREFVHTNSGEVRSSVLNLDRDVRELIQDDFRKHGHVDKLRYNAFTMFAAVKQLEAEATWLAKYRNLRADTGPVGLEGTSWGLEHADAVALADKAVRDTQGAGSTVDLPALFRGGNSGWDEVGKLLNVFANFENTASNRGWLMVRQGGRVVQELRAGDWQGARRDFSKIWGGFISYFVLASLFATAFEAASSGSGDKFVEHWSQNFLKGTLGGAVPGGNLLAELPTMIQSRDHSFPSEPFGSAMEDLVKAAVSGAGLAANHHEWVDPHWVEHAANTIGYATFLPTKPVSKAGQFLWDLTHNKVENATPVDIARGLVFGPRPASGSSTPNHRFGRHR